MMKNESEVPAEIQDEEILSERENLTAIHVAAQLMCRLSEGRQTYPLAKNIVMLTEKALEDLKKNESREKGKA